MCLNMELAKPSVCGEQWGLFACFSEYVSIHIYMDLTDHQKLNLY